MGKFTQGVEDDACFHDVYVYEGVGGGGGGGFDEAVAEVFY